MAARPSPFDAAPARPPAAVGADELGLLHARYRAARALYGDDLWSYDDGRALAIDLIGHEQLVGDATFCDRSLATYWNVVDHLDAGLTDLFVFGERGAGKGVIAEAAAVHLRRTVETVNCALLHPDHAESFLFGVEGESGYEVPRDGTYGVVHRGAGRVLFFDELFSAPPRIFPMLLRLIQDRRFRRLGGGRRDVRESTLDDCIIIAASNRFPTRRRLDEALEREEVPPDLVDRFRGRIEVAPLRERKREIPHLGERILARHRERTSGHGRYIGLDGASAAALRDHPHPWPGNVRELETVLQLAAMYRADVDQDRLVLPASLLATLLDHGNAPAETEAKRAAPDRLDAWRPEARSETRHRQLVAALRARRKTSRSFQGSCLIGRSV